MPVIFEFELGTVRMEHSHFGVVLLCCGKVEAALIHILFNVVHHLVLSDEQKVALESMISLILNDESLSII